MGGSGTPLPKDLLKLKQKYPNKYTYEILDMLILERKKKLKKKAVNGKKSKKLVSS